MRCSSVRWVVCALLFMTRLAEGATSDAEAEQATYRRLQMLRPLSTAGRCCLPDAAVVRKSGVGLLRGIADVVARRTAAPYRVRRTFRRRGDNAVASGHRR